MHNCQLFLRMKIVLIGQIQGYQSGNQDFCEICQYRENVIGQKFYYRITKEKYRCLDTGTFYLISDYYRTFRCKKMMTILVIFNQVNG